MSVTINQQVSVDAAPVHLVTFKVHNLKLMFVQQTYNSKIDVLLESISSFQTRQEKVIDIIKSSHIQEEKGLFKVEFIQVSTDISVIINITREIFRWIQNLHIFILRTNHAKQV